MLFGDVNPSGRLPYTVAHKPEDYGPTSGVLYLPNAPVPQVNFSEGVYVDYRYFDKQGIAPRFEFGFGLSYTTFAYSGLRIWAVQQWDSDSVALERAWARGEASPNVEGGSTALWLHRPAFEVTFRVRNTGKVKGGEVRFLSSLCFCFSLSRHARS